MIWKKIVTLITAVSLISLSACHLQFAGPPSGKAVASAIAQTMSVQTSLADALAGTLTAMVPAGPVSTPIPSLTPTSPFTPTPAVPIVGVSIDTNCRTGPGKAYDMVGALPVGQNAEVIGRDAYNQYWLIHNPSNPSTVCWLWGYYATVTGDTSRLPVATPPPTPTPVAAFTFSYINFTNCGATYAFRFMVQNTGTLTWESIRLVITDNTTATTFTHILNGFRSFNGCSVEVDQAEIMSGEGGAVANRNPGQLNYNPAGHSFTATAMVCSENDLVGKCLSQTINFTP